MSKVGRENVAMVSIDYKKAYDMFAKSCSAGDLKVYKIFNKVINLITEVVKNWKWY